MIRVAENAGCGSTAAESPVPLVFSEEFKSENRTRESFRAQPYVPCSEKLKTKFQVFASRIAEVAEEKNFAAEWGRNPENPMTYYVEVWGVDAARFDEFVTEAQQRMIP